MSRRSSNRHGNAVKPTSAACPPGSAVRPVVMAVHLALTGTVLVAAGSAPSAHAQASSEQPRRYAIPAGALTAALNRFADEAGIFLTAPAELTQGKTSLGLAGTFTVEQGFAELLKGQELQAFRQSTGGYALRRAVAMPIAAPAPTAPQSESTLPAVRVVASSGGDDGSAEQGYRTNKVSAVGPWQGRALQDTPFSISVVPQEQLQNLQAVSADQVYRISPTVQTSKLQQSNDQPRSTIRGFSQGTNYRDGLPNDWYGHGVTMEDTERVEILSGLSGFLYGPGNVGGVVNYVSKRPTAERLKRVTIGNAGGSSYYLHGDFGGQIGNDGQLGYRINAVTQSGETVVKRQDVKKRFLSAAIDWKVASNLLWQFDAAYRNYEQSGSQSGWTIPSGVRRPSASEIDSSISWGQDWLTDTFDIKRFGTGFKWDATDKVAVRGAVRHTNVVRRTSFTDYAPQTNGSIDMTLWNVWAPGDSSVTDEIDTVTGQIFADIGFKTGDISHKFTAGVQYQNMQDQYPTRQPAPINYTGLPFRPYYVSRPAVPSVNREPTNTVHRTYTTWMVGDDIIFNNQWSMLAGFALSTIEQVRKTPGVTATPYRESAVTPNVALIYKPAENLTTYASYIESLEQGGTAADTFGGFPVVNARQVMKPLISKQLELGAKTRVSGVNLTAALFQIDKSLQYYDISAPTAPRFVQDGLQVHTGFEITAVGNVTRNLTLSGGLTWLDPKVKKQQQTPSLEGKKPTNVASMLAKAWAEYRVPGVPGLFANAGVSYIGSRYGDSMNTDKIPSYVLLDVGARYETQVKNFPLSFRLGINNIGDKRYWVDSTQIGEPRSVRFSITADF